MKFSSIATPESSTTTLPKYKVTKLGRVQSTGEGPRIPLIYGTAPTKYGTCLAAFKGEVLCYLAFFDDSPPIKDLQGVWHDATLTEDCSAVSVKIEKLFSGEKKCEMFLRGTDFQMKVWEELLYLKKGSTTNYYDLTKKLKMQSFRAVATAVAANRIAYFVPCHRVIKRNGEVHRYRFGDERKKLILKDEGAI